MHSSKNRVEPTFYMYICNSPTNSGNKNPNSIKIETMHTTIPSIANNKQREFISDEYKRIKTKKRDAVHQN